MYRKTTFWSISLIIENERPRIKCISKEYSYAILLIKIFVYLLEAEVIITIDLVIIENVFPIVTIFTKTMKNPKI